MAISSSFFLSFFIRPWTVRPGTGEFGCEWPEMSWFVTAWLARSKIEKRGKREWNPLPAINGSVKQETAVFILFIYLYIYSDGVQGACAQSLTGCVCVCELVRRWTYVDKKYVSSLPLPSTNASYLSAVLVSAMFADMSRAGPPVVDFLAVLSEILFYTWV